MVAAAGIGIDQVEEILEKEAQIIENERRLLQEHVEKEEKTETQEKEQHPITSFPLRNATTKITNQ